LADLFAFVDAYAGAPGESVGKTIGQRTRAANLRFDLELKRVPFHPALINDGYTGEAPALLEKRVLEAVRAANAVKRTTVRSFDHRCVRFLRQMEPGLTGAILTAYTSPVSPGDLARAADAQIYCPSYEFADAALVRQAHAEGVRVLAWTVNEPDEWARLVDWGVDGITTDYPDRLANWLRERGMGV
jgi:glycerophosphoryl diester phosphodiesterase